MQMVGSGTWTAQKGLRRGRRPAGRLIPTPTNGYCLASPGNFNTIAYGFAAQQDEGGMNARLGKSDWVEAGLKALADQGVDAVRVERLAEALGVTKGSFYWHFTNRDALLAAMLEAWNRVAAGAIIVEVEAAGGEPLDKLRRLLPLVAGFDGRMDFALRRWSAIDPNAREVQRKIDQLRVDYLGGLFAGLGFPHADAFARARLIYHALIGQFAMGMPVPPEERAEEATAIVLPLLTGRPERRTTRAREASDTPDLFGGAI